MQPIKKAKIIIIGFGSIGKRHYKNLLRLGYKNVFVYDIESKKISKDVKTVANLDQTTLADFSIAFICTPTNLHIKYALMCARAGCHLFIEKPLSHDRRGVNQLIKICRDKKLVNMVACNFRFNKGFQKLEKIVKKKSLGRPLTARVMIGHDLSRSRPGVDYRQTYAASADGGVIFDSGAHSIEYLEPLFGKVSDVVGFSGRRSALEIKTEDFADAVITYQEGVVVSLRLDYFSKPKQHNVEIQFERGWARWDFVKNEVSWYDERKKEYKNFVPYGETEEEKRNAMYVEEIKSFMLAIDEGKVIQNIRRAKEVIATLQLIKDKTTKL